MSELTSVATLTELQQKLVENRRELKRRVESLRTFLWTALESLESNQPVERNLDFFQRSGGQAQLFSPPTLADDSGNVPAIDEFKTLRKNLGMGISA